MNQAGMPAAFLVVRHTGQTFPLGLEPITIGRSAGNTIILEDPEVSRYHAEISWRGAAHYVQDLGSANGTFVDERRLVEATPLRAGSVLRAGGTLFDVRGAERAVPAQEGSLRPQPGQAPAPEPGAEIEDGFDLISEAPQRRWSAPVVLGLLAGGFIVICLLTALVQFLFSRDRSSPTVSLQSPADGAQLVLGQPVALQASAAGARDITRLELRVDGVVVAVASSPDPGGQSSLATGYTHIFGQAGSHEVSAVAYTAGNRSSAPASHRVRVIDAAGRVTPGLSPTPSSMPTQSPTPTPSPTVTPTGTVTATLTPSPVSPPAIAFFRANPAGIRAGECTVLEWGEVSGAVAATIDHGIGGVGTPGSRQVCPASTTAYIMTASGPGGVTTAEANVTVAAALPDLIVEAVTFVPDPPVAGRETQVSIVVRNVGAGAAAAFSWDWRPGSSPARGGQVSGGLPSGASIVVTALWRPEGAELDLPTVARADVSGSVTESNEANNQLQVNTQVVQPSRVTLSLSSQAALDGYVVDGQSAVAVEDLRAGNVSDGASERAVRGFVSFDLSQIPAGATIESAELLFYQVMIEGDPYGKLGALSLVLVDYGASLEVEDFAGAGYDSVILPQIPVPEAWYRWEGTTLGEWIAQSLDSGRERFQLRLQFVSETDDGTTTDQVLIESGDNALGTGNVAQLTVTYTP